MKTEIQEDILMIKAKSSMAKSFVQFILLSYSYISSNKCTNAHLKTLTYLFMLANPNKACQQFVRL